MIKKIAFFMLLVAAIACGTWGYLYLTNLKRPTTNPLSVLPDSCFTLIETKNLHELTQKLNQGNLMWEDFLKTNTIKEFNDLLLHTDSLCTNNPADVRFDVQSVFVALYQSKKCVPLIAFNLLDINTNDFFLSFLEKNFSAKKTVQNIYECNYMKNIFYAYVHNGLVLLCSEKSFLQQAIDIKKSLLQNKLFAQAYQEKNKDSDINMFVHLPFFYKKSWNTLFASSSNNKYGSENEAWILADGTLQASEISAQGFLSDDGSVFYNTLKNQESVNFKDVFEMLPYQTAKLQALNIGKYESFIAACYSNQIEQRKQDLQFYTEKLNANTQIEIEKFIGDYAVLFDVSAGEEKQTFGLINFTQEKLANDFLQAVSDSSIQALDNPRVFINTAGDLFSLLSGKFFTHQFKYIICANNAFLFGNTIETLLECKKEISQKNNFSVNEQAIGFIHKNVSEESSYLFFADVLKSKKDILSGASKNILNLINQYPEMIDKYEFTALTIEKLKSNLFFKTCVNFSPKTKLYQNTLWETLLDTDLYINPRPVKNHITNETELVCADEKNNLYLLSNTGKILWKKNIGEKILGQIHQVDYFGNNKLQLLFNTENKLLIIDRNGNYVSGFPVKLASAAANGLTLFDYEKNKNYRLWIPQKNNTTVCYAINGKQLLDFSPIKNIGSVIRLVLQQKDYFVLIDTLGNINVCNRKGETRIKVSTKIEENPASVFIEQGKNIESTYICYIKKSEKKLIKISLTDKTQQIQIPIEGEILYAFIDTLQNQTNPLLVCATENKLSVFDFFGKKLHETVLNFTATENMQSLLFNESHIYTTLELGTDNLFLLDVEKNKVSNAEIKLSTQPFTYQLIDTQTPYWIGYFGNKVFVWSKN